MTRHIILAASALALAIVSSQAFAYSNVSPKEATQKTTPAPQYRTPFFASGRMMPSSTIEPNYSRVTAGQNRPMDHVSKPASYSEFGHSNDPFWRSIQSELRKRKFNRGSS